MDAEAAAAWVKTTGGRGPGHGRLLRVTSELTGDLASDLTVDVVSDVASDAAGDAVSDPASDAAGDAVSDPASDAAGDAVSDPAGDAARDAVWWPEDPDVERGRVVALTVSYNARELTAFLLWSLRTIVTWPNLEIVVVDNGSRDGSARMLADAAQNGICTLLANDDNRQHGPALNQGISHLATRPSPRPEWIWVLDSDVVATSPDALSAAIATAQQHSAALVGEPQHDQWHTDGRFGLFSLLIDPAVVWHEPIGPFTDGGDPAYDLLTSAADQGVPMAAFPYTAAGHVIHRGRGSLAAVHAAEDRDHSLYTWAETHHAAHYAEVPGADQRYQELLDRFRKESDFI